MAKSILIDPSILIDFLRQKDKTETVFYKTVKEFDILKISIITYCELYSGKSVWESKLKRLDLDKLFTKLIIVDLNKEISVLAGKIRAYYNLDLIDSIIAATALYCKIPLATINTKHFKKIEKLEII